MQEILNHLGISDKYDPEVLLEMLESACEEDDVLAEMVQEYIDEITYLSDCRKSAELDCFMAEIEYGDGNIEVPDDILDEISYLEEEIKCRD